MPVALDSGREDSSRVAVCVHCRYEISYTDAKSERDRVWSEMAEHETVCDKNPVLLMVTAAEAERDLWKSRYDEVTAKHPTADYERARYRRWSIQENGDGTLSICKGDHDRAMGCDYEGFIPESHHISLLNAHTELCEELRTHAAFRVALADLVAVVGGLDAQSRAGIETYDAYTRAVDLLEGK